MAKGRTLWVVAAIAASFVGLAGTIVLLSLAEILSVAVAKLMLVALVGMYIGFGFLIVVYRLLAKLD